MASLSPSSSLNHIVSQDEFKTFHNIDRMLYTRLVVNLDRDPSESMQVMALWIWLERAGHVGNLVDSLLSLPDTLINSMANEAVLCLNCIQNDHFHVDNFLPHYRNYNIPLIHSVTKTGLSLQFFHENRLSILRSLSKIVNQVCSRAFQDISAQVADKSKLVAHQTNNNQVHQYVGGGGGNYGSGGGFFGHFMHGYDPYNEVALLRQILNNEIGDALNHINICTSTQEEKDSVPADDRTIFLTFSKGYPILEDEIRDFFSRKYGDCIEAIYMQEVMVGDHQPLYARLVVHSPAMIQIILEGNTKAKFSINGKHVWARKYVRKNPRSPPQSSSPSQPTSPAAPSSS